MEATASAHLHLPAWIKFLTLMGRWPKQLFAWGVLPEA